MESNPTGAEDIVNHGLSEYACLSDAGIFTQYVEWYRDRAYPLNPIDGRRFKADSPADRYFLEGKNAVVYDETLEAIDAYGIALMPLGMDWISDLTGTLYSGWYGDELNRNLYGAGLLMPVVSAGAVKASASELKAFLRGELTLVNEGGTPTLKAVAKGTDVLQPFLSQLDNTWTPELKATLTKEIGDLLKGSADDAARVKMAGAWRLMYDRPILRKDPALLSSLVAIMDKKSVALGDLVKAIDNVYNRLVPGFGTKSLFVVLEKIKDVPGFEALVKQLGYNGSGIRKGVAYVLKKADEIGVENIKGFEVKILVSDSKSRVYDILLKNDMRIECKSWSKFYEKTIETQFLKGDLVGAEKLSNIRYFVNEADMSLDDWFKNMSDFMLKHADDVWKEKKALTLFEKAAEQEGLKIKNVNDLKTFISEKKELWFDIIFNQKL